MKLLFCHNCYDVFSLSDEEKKCGCGQTSGKYIDKINAEYSGKLAVPIGFHNTEFLKAIRDQPKNGMGENFTAFVIPIECKSFKKI